MENQDSIFTDLQPEEKEAAYFPRLFSTLVDVALNVIVLVLLIKYLSPVITYTYFRRGSFSIYIIVMLLMMSYRVACLFLFGKTIGMLVCRLKYLNRDRMPLSAREKLIAVFVTQGQGIKLFTQR